MSKGMNIALWVLQTLIAVFFLFTAYRILTGGPQVAEMFRHYGYPEHFYLLTGILEGAGALLLVIPATGMYGAITLMVVMVGATATHLLHSEMSRAPVPFILLIFLAVIAWARRTKPTSR
jgi:putative oxidoreductase